MNVIIGVYIEHLELRTYLLFYHGIASDVQFMIPLTSVLLTGEVAAGIQPAQALEEETKGSWYPSADDCRDAEDSRR